MITILSIIALYLFFGLLTLALVLKGPEKYQSTVELSYLIFTVLIWPAVLAWLLASRIESPTIRNPFWKRGTP